MKLNINADRLLAEKKKKKKTVWLDSRTVRKMMLRHCYNPRRQ